MFDRDSQRRPARRFTTAWLSICLGLAGSLSAATSWTGNTDNNFYDPSNWSSGVPSSGNTGTIAVSTNNPVTVSSSNTFAPNIYVTNGVGQTASLTVNNTLFGNLSSVAGGNGALELARSGGTATFTQTGASAETNSGYYLIGRSSSTGNATMNVWGGLVRGSNWRVGGSGTGTLNLANATLSVLNYGARGADQPLVIGGGNFTNNDGTGIFNIGDANNPGTVTFTRQYDGQATSLVVRNSTAASGTLRGWGTLSTAFGYATAPSSNPFGGTLTNNGQVIARGFDVDRTLDLSNMPRGVLNTIENNVSGSNSTNGWYATEQGRLLLPGLSVISGANSVNWGEDSADSVIDLVNSVRLSFTNATAGTLTGALLSTDRTSEVVLTQPHMEIVSLWSFNSLAAVQGAGSLSIDVRYDVSTLGIRPESGLTLWQNNGLGWFQLSASQSLASRQLSASNLTSAGATTYFAVMIPEPTTATLAFAGSLLLLVRRRMA